MKLMIDGRELIFNTSSTKAKKFSITVTPEGLVTLLTPSGTTETDIINFIKKNSSKIFKYEDYINNRQVISSNKVYNDTETFLYLGKVIDLISILNTIPETNEEAQLLLKKFYTSNTKKIIKKRVSHFEKIINVKSKKVTIVDSPATWGTCDYLHNLTFNYKLSMAPLEVIDYVVIHELCHILHLNHDRSFWRKVGCYDPNFKKHEDYLSQFGIIMTI